MKSIKGDISFYSSTRREFAMREKDVQIIISNDIRVKGDTKSLQQINNFISLTYLRWIVAGD